MNYDKRSFTAGLAVGRQLKGWATSGGGSGPGPTPEPDFLRSMVMLGEFNDIIINDSGIRMVETPEIILGEFRDIVINDSAIKMVGAPEIILGEFQEV